MCAFCDHQREVIARDFDVVIGPDYDAVKHDVPWHDFGYNSWWGWLRANAWLWSLAPAIDGAVGAISALRDRGHRPQLLTAKPAWAEPQVWKWLSRWNPRFDSVQFCGVDEPKSVKSDADVLIDDRVDVVQEWVRSDSSRMAVLFGQFWNQDFAPEPRIVRVNSWTGALQVIREMEDA